MPEQTPNPAPLNIQPQTAIHHSWRVVVLITVLTLMAAGVTVFFIYKNIKADQKAALDLTIPIHQNQNELKDWKTYESAEHGFSISYPPSYTISTDNDGSLALEKVTIQAITVGQMDVYYGLNIFVLPNPKDQTLAQWTQDLKEQIEKDQSLCFGIKNEADTRPCFGLETLFQNDQQIIFQGQPAIYVEEFDFDNQKGCWYLSHGKYIYKFCRAVENPDDAAFSEHAKIEQQILDTLKFNDQTSQTDTIIHYKTHTQEVGLYSIDYPEEWVVEGGAGDSVGSDAFLSSSKPPRELFVLILFGNEAVDPPTSKIISEKTITLDGTPAIRQEFNDDDGKWIVRIKSLSDNIYGLKLELYDPRFATVFDKMITSFKFKKNFN